MNRKKPKLLLEAVRPGCVTGRLRSLLVGTDCNPQGKRIRCRFCIKVLCPIAWAPAWTLQCLIVWLSENRHILETAMKTQGEIEAAICQGMGHFEQDYMGRGPKNVHAHLIGDLILVRLQGVLTAAEQQLVKSLPSAKGRDLLKEVRTQLMETARPLLEAMVQEVTGVKVLSLHHDISTVTGEEVVLFTLTQAPSFRETKKK